MSLQIALPIITGLLILLIGLAVVYNRAKQRSDYLLEDKRRQTLEEQVGAMQKQIDDQATTIRVLQDDRMRDLKRYDEVERKLVIAERRIRELEAELETYRKAGKPSYKQRRLTGAQIAQLQRALLECYPTQSDWEQLLLLALNRNLDTVSLAGDLSAVATRVIRKANSEGWIVELLRGAAAQRPQVEELQKLTLELLRVLGA